MKKLITIAAITATLLTNASASDSKAEFELGMQDYQVGAYKQAFDHFQKSANIDQNGNAHYNLAIMYKNARGTNRNFTKMFEHLEKASQDNHGVAQYNLGIMNYAGQHTKQNFTKALDYFKKSSDNGYVEGTFNAGIMYMNAQGTERNDKEAYNYFVKAAEKLHPTSVFNVGFFNEIGKGTKQNYKKAREFYTIAKMTSGSQDAINNLKSLARKEKICKIGVENTIYKAIEASAELSHKLKFSSAAEKEGIQKGYYEQCVQRDLKRSIGLNLNYTVSDKHGAKYNFDSELYCFNWTHFLAEIENDKELMKAFAAFAARPQVAYENAIEDEYNIKGFALVDYLQKTQIRNKYDLYIANKFAYQIFKHGSQNDDLGFRENDFQEFLLAVTSRNYELAKQILKSYDYQLVIDSGKDQCKTF